MRHIALTGRPVNTQCHGQAKANSSEVILLNSNAGFAIEKRYQLRIVLNDRSFCAKHIPRPFRGPKGTGLLNEAEAAALWLDKLRALMFAISWFGHDSVCPYAGFLAFLFSTSQQGDSPWGSFVIGWNRISNSKA